MITEFKRQESAADDITYSFKLNNYLQYLTIDTNPTKNCQMFSVKNFMTLLTISASDTDICAVIKAIKADFGKKVMLVDLNYDYMKAFEKLFVKSRIILRTEYKSTNGSNMCLYLVNIDTL